jgi:hypothetical protein
MTMSIADGLERAINRLSLHDTAPFHRPNQAANERDSVAHDCARSRTATGGRRARRPSHNPIGGTNNAHHIATPKALPD